MFKVLEPLHARLERGPQTLKETSFQQAYGRDLNEAQEWCQRYKVIYKLFLYVLMCIITVFFSDLEKQTRFDSSVGLVLSCLS